MSIRSEQIILRCIIYINIVVFYNLYLHTTGIVLGKRLGGFSWGAPGTPKLLGSREPQTQHLCMIRIDMQEGKKNI